MTAGREPEGRDGEDQQRRGAQPPPGRAAARSRRATAGIRQRSVVAARD
jgi:hypothetical protein